MAHSLHWGQPFFDLRWLENIYQPVVFTVGRLQELVNTIKLPLGDQSRLLCHLERLESASCHILSFQNALGLSR